MGILFHLILYIELFRKQVGRGRILRFFIDFLQLHGMQENLQTPKTPKTRIFGVGDVSRILLYFTLFIDIPGGIMYTEDILIYTIT